MSIENEMTGIFSQTLKKTSLLVSFILAVGIHTLVFTIPVKEKIASGLTKAISVSIVSTNEPEALSPPVQQTVKPVIKPLAEPKTVVPSESAARLAVPTPHETSVEKVADLKKVVVESFQKTIAHEQPAAYSKQEPQKEMPIDRASAPVEPETVKSEALAGKFYESVAIEKHMAQGVLQKEGQSGATYEGTMTYAMPKYKDNPPPQYPRNAKRRGYEGRTVLRVEVFEDGKVGHIAIAESSGFTILDRAALKSVKRWIFIPGTKNGKAIRQLVDVPVKFQLE